MSAFQAFKILLGNIVIALRTINESRIKKSPWIIIIQGLRFG